MTYYTITCPYCKHIIKFHTRSKTSRGVPFKVCARCGNTYVDNNCYEPALFPYQKDSALKLVFLSLFGALLFSVLPSGLFAYILSPSKENSVLLRYWVIAFVVLFVALSILLIVVMFKRRSENDAREYEEWKESEKRLCDREYAERLKNVGFSVPDKYLSSFK